MSLRKEYELAAKSALRQQHVTEELQMLLLSIERAEGTIVDLKTELESVNELHGDRQTTQQDIDYLNALLKCAHKKLGWEKQVLSLKKRVPDIMKDISDVMSDQKNPPNETICATLLQSLERVKAAIDRLEQVGLN